MDISEIKELLEEGEKKQETENTDTSNNNEAEPEDVKEAELVEALNQIVFVLRDYYELYSNILTKISDVDKSIKEFKGAIEEIVKKIMLEDEKHSLVSQELKQELGVVKNSLNELSTLVGQIPGRRITASFASEVKAPETKQISIDWDRVYMLYNSNAISYEDIMKLHLGKYNELTEQVKNLIGG